MDTKAHHEHARIHVSPKLRRSLRLYLIISAALLVVVIYEAIHYHAGIWQIGLGLLAGIVTGAVLARIYKISWDEDASHVISNIDIYGVFVLVAYVAFDLSRDSLVHVFTHSEAVPAISLALLAGAMYGRVVGSGRVILKVLREQQIFTHMHRD